MCLPDQFNGLVGRHGDDAPRGRELEEEADDTEEVDVGVVHRKVDYHRPAAHFFFVGFLLDQGHDTIVN